MATEARNFTIEICESMELGGVFKGKTPGQAAKKASRKVFKLAPKKKTIVFTLREMTQGSEKKEYRYTATKRELDVPKVIQRGPVSITITHEIDVKRVKE